MHLSIILGALVGATLAYFGITLYNPKFYLIDIPLMFIIAWYQDEILQSIKKFVNNVKYWEKE